VSTRIYLPASGAAGLASLAYDTGWNKTSQATRLKAVLVKSDTALASRTCTTSATTPEFHCSAQFQLPGLASQTISGTLKGQIRANVNNVLFNGTVAIGVRVVSPTGATIRGTALAISAPDAVTTPPRISGSMTNRQFMDVSESAALTLTNVVCQTGDVLVIEIGARDVDTSTSRSALLTLGDPSATGDLPEDSTTTTALCPWIEFSSTVFFGLPQGLRGSMLM
jgi:hypothetical protein